MVSYQIFDCVVQVQFTLLVLFLRTYDDVFVLLNCHPHNHFQEFKPQQAISCSGDWFSIFSSDQSSDKYVVQCSMVQVDVVYLAVVEPQIHLI